MTGSEIDRITVTDLLRVFRRHRKKMVLFFCAAMVVLVFSVLGMSKRYSSEAKLLLRIGRETVSLDPTATMGEVIGISRSGQSEINTALEVLKSRDLVDKVVDEIGPDVILEPGPASHPAFFSTVSGWLSSAKSFIAGLVKSEDASDGTVLDDGFGRHNAAVNALLERVDISAARESTVISLSAEATSPALAQRIVNTWADIFLDEHVRLTSTEGSYPFFVRQRDKVHDESRATRVALREAKDASELISIEGQQALLETLKAEIAVEQVRNVRQMAATEARCAKLKASIAKLPETVVSQRTDGIADQGHDGMQQQLYSLEIRERELLEKYNNDHPLVQVVQGQVEAVRQILDEQAETLQQTTHAANPARNALNLNLLEEETQLAALQANARSLDKQHDDVVHRIKKLNENSDSIQSLQQQIELLDRSYQVYAEKAEQSRINEAMAAARITSIQVMQTAGLRPEPSGPSRTSLLAAGFLVALMGAAGMALLAERVAPAPHCPQEVEVALKQPVVVHADDADRRSAVRVEEQLQEAGANLVASVVE